MNGATIAVAGTIVGIITSIIVIWLQIRAQGREQQLRDAETRRQQELAVLGARDAGYQTGASDVRRELQPEINRLTSERDEARRQRDMAERELEDAAHRLQALEAEIRRIMRGGNGQ